MTDPIALLHTDLAEALLDAGLPLHDCAGRGSAGGVCLTPTTDGLGGDAVVIVTWGVGERLRGDARYLTYQAVLDRMNAALADVVAALDFEARPFGRAGATLVTGRRPSETASTESVGVPSSAPRAL